MRVLAMLGFPIKGGESWSLITTRELRLSYEIEISAFFILRR
jgi:hypothetical protein